MGINATPIDLAISVNPDLMHRVMYVGLEIQHKRSVKCLTVALNVSIALRFVELSRASLSGVQGS